MAEKKKLVSMISPKGIFKFPKLNKPDTGTKDYPKPDGEYSTKLVLKADDPATKAFIKKLQPEYQKAMAEADEAFMKLKVETRKKLKEVTQNDLFTTLYDKETEEPTGEIEVKIAMKASGTRKDDTKWFAKPGLFDAKGKPLTAAIWSGTEGKVSFECQPYFIPGTGAAGLKLKLKAVQVIDLVSEGSRSASSYGFEEEDGYEEDDNGASDFNEDDDAKPKAGAIDDDIPF